jgi:DNA (cytosine-5)-methyltransferase 1
MRDTMRTKRNFIDLCAGCGGLSLGLLSAGWLGVFAVEKDELAFSTLSFNLLKEKKSKFDWPDWLPKEAVSLEALLGKHEKDLKKLRNRVDLLAGGPPCQGFSTVGRRLAQDARNQVFKHYLKLVKIVQPNSILIENVRGILFPFISSESKGGQTPKGGTYAEIIKHSLEKLDYKVWYRVVHSKDYGVPQTRPRFILLGVRKQGNARLSKLDPFDVLEELQAGFLQQKQLGAMPVTVKEALSDLCTSANSLQDCPEMPGFKQGCYKKQVSDYQALMHGTMNGALADSHRLANHRPDTVTKFRWLQENCTKGKIIRPEDRGDYSTNKHTIYILDPNAPAPTITTLPDDLLHYAEPRILTVRELARLQSFPDWFEFKGKYTTGSKERVNECPRYTQVGNAVPPLLAEVLGKALRKFLEKLDDPK